VKVKISALLMEAGVSYNKQFLHERVARLDDRSKTIAWWFWSSAWEIARKSIVSAPPKTALLVTGELFV
jgi:hypothetical protein